MVSLLLLLTPLCHQPSLIGDQYFIFFFLLTTTPSYSAGLVEMVDLPTAPSPFVALRLRPSTRHNQPRRRWPKQTQPRCLPHRRRHQPPQMARCGTRASRCCAFSRRPKMIPVSECRQPLRRRLESSPSERRCEAGLGEKRELRSPRSQRLLGAGWPGQARWSARDVTRRERGLWSSSSRLHRPFIHPT